MNTNIEERIEGIYGALPLHFREQVIRERNEGNPALHDFLDLFQNRLLRFWREETEEPHLEPEDFAEESEQFGCGWLDMPESCRTRLGEINTVLGSNANVGKSIFNTGKVHLIKECAHDSIPRQPDRPGQSVRRRFLDAP